MTSPNLRRFPWPADPSQRYCLASPWLAVVNARGPWGVWQHYRKEPAWLPLCESLWRKPWFAKASPAIQIGMLTVWRMAAREDYWGVVWGEPARLCFMWQMEPETLNATLAAMLDGGALVYLTHAEKAAMESWRAGGRRTSDERRTTNGNVAVGEGAGIKGGTIGGESRGGDGVQVRDRGQETETGTATGTGDRRQPTGKHARKVISGSSGGIAGQSTETGTETAERDMDSREGQGHPQGQGKGTGHSDSPREPASLPESDQGSDNRGAVRNRRSPSVSQDAARLGEYLHWADPLAMDFARRMFRAVLGRDAPADATTASRSDRSVLGAWASAWTKKLAPGLNPAHFQAFCQRCERDVAKKRGKAGVRNLGAVAMDKIVPGILRSMAKERG